MYLHIGGNKLISLNNIIGIFNIDLEKNQNNADFLEKFPGKYSGEEESIKNSSIVMMSDKVYYSSISPLTLMRRIEKNE